ncbi:hypothetical protein L9F63_024637, partial [Diploptera punctata]
RTNDYLMWTEGYTINVPYIPRIVTHKTMFTIKSVAACYYTFVIISQSGTFKDRCLLGHCCFYYRQTSVVCCMVCIDHVDPSRATVVLATMFWNTSYSVCARPSWSTAVDYDKSSYTIHLVHYLLSIDTSSYFKMNILIVKSIRWVLGDV